MLLPFTYEEETNGLQSPSYLTCFFAFLASFASASDTGQLYAGMYPDDFWRNTEILNSVATWAGKPMTFGGTFLDASEDPSNIMEKLEPKVLTIAQGSSVTLNLSYDYTPGFIAYAPNPSEVTLESPPQGIEAEPVSFLRNDEDVMTIRAATNAPLGTFTIQALQRESGTGRLFDQETLELTIVASN